MSSTSASKVGILSMGAMGAGIAALLKAKGMKVATNCQGRSEETIERAQEAGAELLQSDLELVQQCAVILSVVPPKDAEATAQRVADALSGGSVRSEPLYFLELNAVSPSTGRAIEFLFQRARVPVRVIDGCIIGGPPTRKAADGQQNDVDFNSNDAEWDRPNIPISGPYTLSELPDGEKLSSALNLRSIGPDIGSASGLKMCFAAMAKGYTALATQSFATAHKLGVADELRRQLTEIMPANLTAAERRVPGMPPKAYRWVREMEEIAKTMSEDGGWAPDMFMGIAGVYQAVADDPVLGQEKIGKRSRGKTVDDVAELLADGLAKKKKKME